MTVPEARRRTSGATGVVLRDALPWSDAVQVVQTAEETGYDAVFVPEIESREAFATLSGYAQAAPGLRVGTGVVTIWARSPATTAMAAATVHDLSGGRMILGIGAGATPPGPRGAGARPLALTEEYVRVVRGALAGELVESDPFGVPRFRLGLRLESPPPVWLAALGDRMLALAGRAADGVILNWCTPERVAEARQTLDEAAERAGRDPGVVTVSVYVRACLGQEDHVALPPLRAMAGQYASFPAYRRQMERMGLEAEAEAGAAAHRAGKPGEVPEALVRALTVTGSRMDALARFEAYRQAGADLILCYPVAARDPFSSVLGTVLAAAPSPAVER